MDKKYKIHSWCKHREDYYSINIATHEHMTMSASNCRNDISMFGLSVDDIKSLATDLLETAFEIENNSEKQNG